MCEVSTSAGAVAPTPAVTAGTGAAATRAAAAAANHAFCLSAYEMIWSIEDLWVKISLNGFN